LHPVRRAGRCGRPLHHPLPSVRAEGSGGDLAAHRDLFRSLAVPLSTARRVAALTMAGNILEVRQLEVVYNRVATAIQGVSLDVPAGSIVALVGTNGAGKTTTLRAISGFLPSEDAEITDGEIKLSGRRINGTMPHRLARDGVILVPEREKVFATLT